MEPITEDRAALLLRHLDFPVPATPGWGAAVVSAATRAKDVPREPVPTWAVGEERVRHRDPAVPVTARTLVCSCGGRSCVHVAGVLLSLAMRGPEGRGIARAPDWEVALAGIAPVAVPADAGTGELSCELRRPAPGWLGLEPELWLTTDGRSVRCPRRADELAARVADPGPALEVHAAWLALEQARRLERGHRPILVRHLTRALLGPLQRLGRVTLEGSPVHVSTRPVRPRLVADVGEDGGLALRWTPELREVWVDVELALTTEGELRPIADGVSEGTVARLKDALPAVPADQVRRFVTKVVVDQGIDVALPAHLDPVGTAEVKAARLSLAEVSGDLRVRLELRYATPEGEVVVRTDTPGSTARIPGALLVRRDLDWEDEQTRRFARDLGGRHGELTLSGDEAVDWLRDVLPGLAARWEVHGEERLVRHRVRGTLAPRLRFDESEDWFDLDVGFELGGRKVAPGLVLERFRRGERYVRLDDGSLAELPTRWLERHATAVDDLLEVRRAQRGLSGWHAWRMADLLREAGGADRWLRWVDERDGVARTDVPEGLSAELRTYQRSGLDWLVFLRDHGLHGILADEMGLGKTLQALAAILEGRGDGDPPALVVCPTSVVHAWVDEAARFAPGLKTVARVGPRRHELRLGGVDLVVTSYALLRRDAELLASHRWSWAVLDEGQHVKNPASQTARAARRLQADHRLVLTGTPLENDLTELWSLFQFLMPGLLGRRSTFHARYAVASRRDGAPGAELALAELSHRIRPFVLRRRKSEVAKELPPRTERVVRVDLSERERALYEAIRATVRTELAEARRDGRHARNGIVLEGLLRLRQACCHPGLLPFPEAKGLTRGTKIDALTEMLQDAIPGGSRALVFSQWVGLLDRAAAALEVAGIAYARLDGSTEDRAGFVATFQDPDGPPVALISIKAGGTGLTLTAADLVFLLDPWWNPAVEAQATDRAHRIGQTRPVEVIRLVAADTVEDRVLALQAHKRRLFERTVDGPALDVSALTTDDLLGLLADYPSRDDADDSIGA
ncbi:MAG: DEAD/DEAH box helicase [Alphaproteobacteria bacterium]|nr:DEAD/DEAH box helicase [Alphaproteobacteria bacterium]